MEGYGDDFGKYLDNLDHIWTSSSDKYKNQQEYVTGLVPSDDPGTGSNPVTERNSVNDQVGSDPMVSPNRGETLDEVPKRNDVPYREGKESKVMRPKEILK